MIIGLLALLSAATPAHASSTVQFESAVRSQARTLIPALAAPLAVHEEETLIELLEDRDPAVRASAAKALGKYASFNNKVERKLQEVAADSRELDSVRREALKSLAWPAQNRASREVVAAVAESRRESEGLRAIALKSLYVAAWQDREARKVLRETLESRESAALRGAAAWGLFGDALNDASTRKALWERADDSREDAGVRVEAVKSLYQGVNRERFIQEGLKNLAEDRGEMSALREAAILAHHAVVSDNQVQRWLQDIARGTGEARLRAAAIKASGPLDMELVRYFHLVRTNRNLPFQNDPLEDQ